ncbi:MAG: cation:proton antiporter [Cyanobacteria bacterium]|nr:cation:proton antiporter [Cyanobacteriota bacterium]
MTGYINLVFRLGIWFLLTANFSPTNIAIGIIVTLLLPRGPVMSSPPRVWAKGIKDLLLAIPQSYLEAFEILLFPHRHEYVTRKRVPHRRTSGMVFLDVLLITLTPKTIVQNYDPEGWYEIHHISRKAEP